MKRKIKLCLLVLAVLVLGACSKKTDTSVLKEGEYRIYYLNAAMTKLVPQVYTAYGTSQQELIEELMNQFLHVPADLDCQPALPEKVGYLGYKQEERVLYLYFDNNYSNSVTMKATQEILCRAALTKTMTQVPDIDFIHIYVGDQPLMDSKGVPVGMLSTTDFIESISDINSYEKTELTLFFTDETGTKLIAEKKEVVHNLNTSLEKLILEQLMAGPDQQGLYPTLPRNIKLLNISVNENVCYLNFDESFLTNVLEVKDYIPIYSIVNSLSELSTVNKVQISINGSQDVMFWDSISLNTLFERKLDIGGT